MGRKEAREVTMQYSYHMEANNKYDKINLDNFFQYPNLNDEDKNFVNKSLDSIIANLSKIDTNIEEFLRGWTIDRISKVDLAILRVAFNEIQYMEDIPVSVSINEAVDMSKKFSYDDSYKFVNGILGAYDRGLNKKKDKDILNDW